MTRIAMLAAALVLSVSACVAEDATSDRSRALETDVPCGERVATIVDANGVEIGRVTVSNDADNLFLDIVATEPLVMKQLWLYAGVDPVPTNSSGIVWPEFFPHIVSFPEPFPQSHSLAIPLADLGVDPDSCGALEIALYVKNAELDANGNVLKLHRGWALGDYDFPHGYDIGYGFTYAICCEPPPQDEGCTLTQGYWKNHNSEAKPKPLRVDWPAPHDEADVLCGRTWLDILNTAPSGGDAWTILAHQYIAARLNLANGASSTDQVDDALELAEEFLTANCGGAHASEAPGAIYLAAVLDSYNNGDLGPGHCE